MNNIEPLIKQGWLRVFLFCIAYFIFQVIGGFMASLLLVVTNIADSAADVAQKLSSGDSVIAIEFIVLFNFISATLLVILFRKTIDRKTLYSLGWDFSNNTIHAATGFFAGIASLGIGTFILTAMKNLHFSGWLVDAKDLFFAFGLMVLAAIGEELMFRGYILNNLMQSANRYAALIISALLFALAHNANPNFNWLAFLNIFLAGLFLGINYIHTQNLWYAIMLHFTWNFFQGPVLGYQVSGLSFQSLLQQELSGSELITGGKFGFEGSIIASAVMVVFILFAAFIYTRKEISGQINVSK